MSTSDAIFDGLGGIFSSDARVAPFDDLCDTMARHLSQADDAMGMTMQNEEAGVPLAELKTPE